MTVTSASLSCYPIKPIERRAVSERDAQAVGGTASIGSSRQLPDRGVELRLATSADDGAEIVQIPRGALPA